MSFLVAKADPYAMRESYIIKPIWPQLKQIASAETIVDIYDKETWGDDKTIYNPVFDVVHKIIAPHGTCK